MNFKKIIILLLAITLMLSLASCKKDKEKEEKPCGGHVDADDNHKCDNCGADFDDGDEVVEEPVVYRNITFIFSLEDGTPVSGVSFTVERGEQSFTLVTDANGSAVKELAVGLYSISCDYLTLPEYCSIDTYGFKVDENSETVNIIITDNTPDGSREKPFPTSDEPTELELAAGQEIFFAYHGAAMQFVNISSGDVVVNYNGESYSPVDGELSVAITPEDIGVTTIFSVKNTTDSAISITVIMTSPLGSIDNPIAMEGDRITADFEKGQIIYYKWTATESGILVATNDEKNANVSLRRTVIKVINGEEIEIPLVSQGEGEYAVYIDVEEGDEIVICLTPASSNSGASISLALDIYKGTSDDPIPVYQGNIAFAFKPDQSLVFEAAAGQKISITDESRVSIYHDTITHGNDDGNTITVELLNPIFQVINHHSEDNNIIITCS